MTTMRDVETVLFLVVVATVVATFARRLRVPAPSLLVVAGVLVGLVPGVPEVRVTPEIVSLVVLPPLLYAAGEELPWRDLRAVWRPVTALAVGLVVASAAAVAAVVVAITGLPVGLALVLGTVLASTDPVAVTALGRRLSLPPRVRALVQAESLFNDATSLLLFRVALTFGLTVGAVSWGHVAVDFLLLAGGGILVGVVVAGGVVLIRRRTTDPVLETVIALVTPYVAYVLAEALHGSGVTAVVVASVVIGTQTARLTTPHIRLQVDAVYRTVVFLLESVVFGLMGLELPTLVRALSGHGPAWLPQALAITATLVVVRVLWVFPLSALGRRQGRRPSWQVPAVVAWAGARGVVPLAAALSIPLVNDAGVPLPGRDLVLLLATAVIVITLVVQGFTLAPLVRWAGVAVTPADVRHEDRVARLHVARAGLDHLAYLADLELAPDVVVDQLRRRLQAGIDRIEADQREGTGTAGFGVAAYRSLRRDVLAVQREELDRLFDAGTISDATRRRVRHGLDLEDAGLGEDP
jgi:monovalent cation/hydrogen antiporter